MKKYFIIVELFLCGQVSSVVEGVYGPYHILHAVVKLAVLGQLSHDVQIQLSLLARGHSWFSSHQMVYVLYFLKVRQYFRSAPVTNAQIANSMVLSCFLEHYWIQLCYFGIS